MGESKRRKSQEKAAPPGRAITPAGEPMAAAPGGAGAAEGGAPSNGDEAARVKPEPIPLSTAPLPLTALDGHWLGAFLELCFPDKRLVTLCRELKIITPGYRLEALPPEQVARVLADEYLAAEDVRPALEAAVRGALRTPLLENTPLTGVPLATALEEVIDAIAVGDGLQHLARVAWAGLLSEDAAARDAAKDAIEEGLQALSAPLRQKGAGDPDKKEARKAVQQARKDVESALKKQEKAERERDSLREQLATARAEAAAREARQAEERGELERLRAESLRLGAEVARLTGEGAGRALSDARRAEAESRSLADRLGKSEEARAAAEERAASLEKQLAAAGERARTQAPAAPAGEELPTDEEAALFLLPVLTREFYDSIDRWSRRMQRAAFDKIHRLANDWRHGSLRALALEGVPGYYRIRVATDVRLIYRRDGNQLEILSLIDREDLDRYIRQARTRPG